MLRFNLTNVIFAISLTGVCCASSLADPNATDQAAVREHVNKGNYFMGRGAWDQAITEYNAALDVDPGSLVAKDNLVLVHNNWGISLFRQHKFDEAKAQWDEALKMNPYDRNAKQNLQVLKAALARIQAAPPKPPVEAGAKLKDGKSGDVKPGDESNAGGAALSSSSKSSGENSSGSKSEESSSGPKIMGGAKPVEAGSPGPKIMSGSSIESSSSGSRMLTNTTNDAGTESSSGAAVINNAPIKPVDAAPPAAANTPAEPAQPAAPAIDMSSPYSFYQPTTPKPGAEVSSPYVMPTNLPSPTNRPAVYTPPAVPKPPNANWTNGIGNPAEAAPTAAPAATPGATTESAGNLEEQLDAIELKVNGKKQKNMPLTKRIEKLENSISGKAGAGTLQERIDVLKKSCGL